MSRSEFDAHRALQAQAARARGKALRDSRPELFAWAKPAPRRIKTRTLAGSTFRALFALGVIK